MISSVVIVRALKLSDFERNLIPKVDAGVVNFFYDPSVSLVLSVDDSIFGVLLVLNNGLGDLGLFLSDLLLEMLSTAFKNLDEDFSVKEEIHLKLLLLCHILVNGSVFVFSLKFSRE